MGAIGKIGTFTNLEVFDLAKNQSTGAIRFLVGIREKDLKGWVEYRSGAVITSNLSVYFSASGTEDIYQSAIGVRNNEILAQRPKNLKKLLDGNTEFPKFPVLFDYRARTATTPLKIKPHLQITFTGRYCAEGQATLCYAENTAPQNGTNLNSADVMFLIDGTKPMRKYFKLVSRALATFAQIYIDNPDYRFGVSTYGDFKNSSQTNTADPLDFKIVDKLQINYGDLFSRLGETKLYIKDVMKDKAGPTNAAIYNAVKTTRWEENRLRFLIHIADHGDSFDPPDLMLASLKENNIFYIPIAVKGDGVIKESDNFVRQSNIIYDKHRTDKGLPMAPQPIVTYQKNIPEYEAIAQALVGAINIGAEAQKLKIDKDNTNTIPPIAAELTQAAMELYFPIQPKQDYETITLKGFIETAAIGERETNWDYFVALGVGELLNLNRSLETVCLNIGGDNDEKIISGLIRQMIETLTGDKLTSDELRDYWADRNSIPLIDQTILGGGMKQFLRDYSDPEKLSTYKKGFCRGYELTRLMMNKKKPEPYEGESLTWQGDYYEYKDAVDHNWPYKDTFERGYYYVPLSYLPN